MRLCRKGTCALLVPMAGGGLMSCYCLAFAASLKARVAGLGDPRSGEDKE